jgi:PAS domain S-box-containing protein
VKSKISSKIIPQAIAGYAVFVVMFFLITAAINSYYSGSLFSVTDYLFMHQELQLLWFIDVVFIVISMLFYFALNGIKNNVKEIEDELGEELSKSNNILHFIEKLRNDEFDVEYDVKDEDDVLGKSLTSLRDALKSYKEEVADRKKEDDQRNWIAEGLAKFGDILRINIDNVEELSYQIISNLGLYLDAIQGSFFMLNDNDENEKFFELSACFAYSRKKYTDRKIEWGEGLIGRAALEKSTIYMDEVPDSYVEITSGLGESNPRSILIVPLKVNEEVHGVIELASFNYFQKYQIEFVEKVAESIASTLSSVKINMRTAELLEDSQEQAERLAQQEEEMRQNVEELQATQEEAAKQAEQFISFTNSVNHTLIRSEYDTNGTLLYANTKFLEKLGYDNNKEVEGSHISIFINDKDKDWFNKIWDTLSQGGKHFEGYMKHVTKDGKDLWTLATYTCVREADGTVEKILFLAIDSTEHKKQSLDYEGQIKALNLSSVKAEFAPNGKLLDVNDKFVETFDYKSSELKNFSVFNLFKEENQGPAEEIWNSVIQQKAHIGPLNFVNKKEEEIWLHTTFSPVLNMYDEVSKVIFAGYDITEQKRMEIKTQEQTKQLLKHEEKLKASEQELSKKLDEARKEMRSQFKEIERVKVRTEKTLEGALDAIFTINQDGLIEFFNRAAENLWGYKRTEVLGNEVRILFAKDRKKHDEFVTKLINPGQRKLVGERKEITITDKEGNDKNVLILLSEAKVDKEQTFTAFIQNIEVELF